MTKVHIAVMPSRVRRDHREKIFSCGASPLNEPLATGPASAEDSVRCPLGSDGRTVFNSGRTQNSSSMQHESQKSRVAARQQLHNVVGTRVEWLEYHELLARLRLLVVERRSRDRLRRLRLG